MSQRLVVFVLLGGSLALLGGRPGVRADKPAAKKVADFTLSDPRDQSKVSLAGLKDKKAVAVVFAGTECPINKAFLPRLAELHKEFAAQGVQFLAVYPNEQDTAERVAESARKNDIPFPVLKDDGGKVADLFGAARTPEAFVLTPDGAVVYQGRIDDQYGYSVVRPKPTRRDLACALDEVLAGKPVTVSTTPVLGCVISRPVKPKDGAEVTYARHVARVLQDRCQNCHRPGQIGPFSLLTYKQAVNWSESIKDVVDDGRMPPWHADPHVNAFSNDRRLKPEEKETLLKWIAQGCAKGDDKDLPPPREFPSEWGVGKPDVVFTMPVEFDVPAEMPKGGVPYKNFTVETNFTEDKWVQMAESRPGAPEVVHHIIVFIVPPGEAFAPGRGGRTRVLCGTAPGDTAKKLPEGTATKVPAGAKLVFQMHYTPNGKAVKDRSSVGLVFAKQPPEREVVTAPVGNRFFAIPAGDANHKVESQFEFREDAKILSFMPHMHLRGKDFLYEAIYPDGKKETLLSVPRFDFNWQTSYRLAKPALMPKGSKIHCVAHFDNSDKNPNNPDPTKAVIWGDQTWEEMMIGWMDFVYERKPQ